MSYPIRSFTWTSEEFDGGRELTPNLEGGSVQIVGEDEDLALLVILEFSDRATADAWSPDEEISVEFTLQEHAGVVEGTAVVTGMKTSLDREASHRICRFRLEPEQMNTGSEEFPDVLGATLTSFS